MSSTTSPTRVEAEHVLQAKKTISVPLNWKATHQGWRLQVKVYAPDYAQGLRLVGFIGKVNYGFVLLYHNYPIRKYTKHAPHQIGGVMYDKPHKHIWDGEDENNEAYIPDDINPEDNINKQFLDFCQECNIEILSDYHWID